MLSIECPGARMLKNLLAAILVASAACAQTNQAEPPSDTSVTGTWVGEISGSLPEDKATVRIAIRDQGGQLMGETFVKDPEGDEFYPTGNIEIISSGSSAHWEESGLSVSGTFTPNGFSGQVAVESDVGPPYEGTIQLLRQSE